MQKENISKEKENMTVQKWEHDFYSNESFISLQGYTTNVFSLEKYSASEKPADFNAAQIHQSMHSLHIFKSVGEL